MSKPNFFCIGAQKSGTTLLHKLLKDIDSVYLPSTKEVHFFDIPNRFDKGLNWYERSYFDAVDKEEAVGEITPSYLYIENVAQNIYESLGENVKFIVIFRNPIYRAYSQYIMRYKNNEETLSFNDAMIMERSRIEDSLEAKRKFSYLDRGFYAQQLDIYLKYFDKKQFLYLEFDDFVSNQDKAIEEICTFLGVKKNKDFKNKRVHSSKLSLKEKIKFSYLNKVYNPFKVLKSSGYPEINKKTVKLLREYYEVEIKRLEKILSKDLSKWLQ